ncbi:hypothetical protein SERLA73DRAFT_121636 [Serpula lacrymans var. lacrymans S7.3]|uniref:Uncharacterized protein n=1 Tax=Serpula lacrymans var. lacrymans (strain S7.3) TaxID=936435 RepID=F8Q8A1_SERL3|nr:hypothetical protein SERLA73DRAFT_142732 [Serpula lacrymans var. lacrymans S7.3]EGN96385.1 hypothetical protein SERLA73DRAFT_125203 [Serpula lacrymans var. lacrymans S7.3]EGN97913.1 hypothetical protein SERLA73DRAFT_169033 [Serpula lacrymans var. lacrymans S7.3]EGO01324.1 hypothetical protein SERLA73DRAFT_121636 [Serpula lacrymans var. lacrymans S7.3]
MKARYFREPEQVALNENKKKSVLQVVKDETQFKTQLSPKQTEQGCGKSLQGIHDSWGKH